MDEQQESWVVPVGDSELIVRADVDRPGPVVVIWPALGVPARFYRPFAATLRTNGFGVVLADYRGQGENRPRIGRTDRFGYHDLATIDFPAVTAEIKKRCPKQPVLLLGHSLGAQIGVSYAARHPGDLAGLVFVAGGTPYFRAYPPLLRARITASIQLVHGIAELVGYWPGDRLKFAGRQPKILMRDWARINRIGRFVFTEAGAATTSYDDDIASLELPVLAVSVEGDSYAPPTAVEDLCRRLAKADVTRWHYEEKLDHFRWVKAGTPIAEKLGAWWAEAPS